MTRLVAAEQFVTEQEVRDAPHCGCIGANSPSSEVVSALIDAASDTIAIVTGMRVMGRVDIVARPVFDAWRTGESWADRPVCSCGHVDCIHIGDDVDITSIVATIDGVNLPDNEIFAHQTPIGTAVARVASDGSRLVCWPSNQKRWRAATQPDTFQLAWRRGVNPTDVHIIKAAAIEIVCDFASDDTISTHLLDGVTDFQAGGSSVRIDPNRLAESGDTRLNRIASGELGPLTRRMMGILVPGGRKTAEVWAPELTDGWTLNASVAP